MPEQVAAMPMPADRLAPAPRRVALAFMLAWLAVIGFDFFWHAGLMPSAYVAPHPFLLPAETAFRRIPLGYASFGVFVALITWLCVRLGARSARHGAGIGLLVGAAAWGSLCLGLASIATAPPSLLAGWFVGQSLESGLAGAVIGAGLGAVRASGLAWRVAATVVAFIAAGVLLQNL